MFPPEGGNMHTRRRNASVHEHVADRFGATECQGAVDVIAAEIIGVPLDAHEYLRVALQPSRLLLEDPQTPPPHFIASFGEEDPVATARAEVILDEARARWPVRQRAAALRRRPRGLDRGGRFWHRRHWVAVNHGELLKHPSRALGDG